MTILNMMLGRGRGGIEQAAVDYAECLAAAGIPAVSMLSPAAWAEAPMVAGGYAHEALANWNAWDPFAARRLRQRAAALGARAVICHGNRALGLALRALKGRVPIVVVAHNYSNKRFAQADHCLAITHQLEQRLAALGAGRITFMPNMVRIPEVAASRAAGAPPVIGTMGRFIPRKGFDYFIEACALLHQRGVTFRAMLGGEGEEEESLRARIRQHGLEGVVTMPGWVSNKPAFYAALDLFVFPSAHEPFGIVLIEAMSYGLAVIAADAEGPSEIIHTGEDGVIVPKQNPAALADAMEALLADVARRQALGAQARSNVTRDYSKQAMADRLRAALVPYLEVA